MMYLMVARKPQEASDEQLRELGAFMRQQEERALVLGAGAGKHLLSVDVL